MIPRRLRPFLISLIAAINGPFALAHYFPELDHGRPMAPPTADPGPDAALLRIHVIDAAAGEPTSATVSVNDGAYEPDDDPYREFSLRQSANRLKGPIRLRQIPYYFYTDGRFEVRVPPGAVSVGIRKGYEYRPAELTLKASKNETIDAEVRLERAIDMASLGWYSGDTHVHLERTGSNDDTLLTLTSAKDVRYAWLLSMNTRGYDFGGTKYESHRQWNGVGEDTVARRGPYHITSGQEYRTTRLGHLTIAMADEYVRASGMTDDTNQGPPLAVIADQVHALNGFVGLAHGGYNNKGSDGLLLERKMDYVELLQFGTYRSLGLEGWYDFLNIGYRLPIVGASDYPPTRELSSEITYVWSELVPTPRSFAEALAAGRSFATSGPMLFLTVGGEKPGAVLRFSAEDEPVLPVDIRVFSPQYPVRYLELIVNGRVIERRFDEKGRSEWTLRHILPVRESGWIAARTYSDAGTDAHTNPVYVEVGDARPFSADSARQIIARLEGSIAITPLPAVVQWLEQLRNDLRRRIEQEGSSGGDGD